MGYRCPLCGKKNVGPGHKHFITMRANLRPYGRRTNPRKIDYAKNRALIGMMARRRRRRKRKR